MILVDSSIWVDHFRLRSAALADLIGSDQVLVHPIVIGELLLGGLPRALPLEDLRMLPAAVSAEDEEVLLFIRRHGLAGSGIGYSDAHLLAAARLTPETALWTRDRRLNAAARRLGLDAGIEASGGVHED